ncbi:hypothetical protein Y032_0521g2859 [Ancylostoma ceylanicum]|uniref:Uncharacterized protein n=1 Tax=Ancylostoma ceylanicum TaxID=53326 RepID=A0A016WTV5_9BILA|nr:hypothetical protein Y032_0521g2859 [Ancylostoma ceylanicum]
MTYEFHRVKMSGATNHTDPTIGQMRRIVDQSLGQLFLKLADKLWEVVSAIRYAGKTRNFLIGCWTINNLVDDV